MPHAPIILHRYHHQISRQFDQCTPTAVPGSTICQIGQRMPSGAPTLSNYFSNHYTVPTPLRVERTTLPNKPAPSRVANETPPNDPDTPHYHTRLQARQQQCNFAQAAPNESRLLLTPENTGTPIFPLANAVIDPNTGIAREYCQLIAHPKTCEVWLHSAANTFGRLAQGVKAQIKGTNTINFIAHTDFPTGRTVTYAQLCANIRPQKEETHRCRITVSGDCIDYYGEVSTKTAGLTTIKLLLNSVVSKPTGQFMTADIKNFYLNTPLECPEYMRIPLKLIPQ